MAGEGRVQTSNFSFSNGVPFASSLNSALALFSSALILADSSGTEDWKKTWLIFYHQGGSGLSKDLFDDKLSC